MLDVSARLSLPAVPAATQVSLLQTDRALSVELQNEQSVAPSAEPAKTFPVYQSPETTQNLLDAGDLTAHVSAGPCLLNLYSRAGVNDTDWRFANNKRSYNQDTCGAFRLPNASTGLVLCDGRGKSADAAIFVREWIRQSRTANPDIALQDLPALLQKHLFSLSGRRDASGTTLTYAEIADDGKAQVLQIGDSPFWIRKKDGTLIGPFSNDSKTQFVMADQYNQNRYEFSGFPQATLFQFTLQSGDTVILMSDGVPNILGEQFTAMQALDPANYEHEVIPVIDARVAVMLGFRELIKNLSVPQRIETPYGWLQFLSRTHGSFYANKDDGTEVGRISLDNYTLATLAITDGAELLDGKDQNIIKVELAGEIFLKKNRADGEEIPLEIGRGAI